MKTLKFICLLFIELAISPDISPIKFELSEATKVCHIIISKCQDRGVDTGYDSQHINRPKFPS